LIKVVIADDHPLVRMVVRTYLESDGGFDVLAVGGTGEEAVDLVREHSPDVVVLDYQMPVLDGLEAARTIGETHPDVGIVMLTGADDQRVAREAAGAGVGGFVLKTDPPEALADTVRAVAAGESGEHTLTVIVEPGGLRDRSSS
jgi:DNA-binding NarL/FixJ family response regulator